MESDFSLLELRIIQKLVKTKSDQEIAEILDRSVKVVSDYTSRLARERNIITRQQIIEKRKNKAIKKVPNKKQRKIGELETADMLKSLKAKNVAGPARKKVEPAYETKSIDYSKKILVKLDSKTSVYADPGADIELLKKKYAERINKGKVSLTKGYVEVKKFKPVR